MTSQNLGRLERVELRDIWLTEATDFTPWLARRRTSTSLGNTRHRFGTGGAGKVVGPFRADILCKDIGTDRWVLIENQLERTDHDHLGQLLTYASGLEAVTIVWIAARFTEEHRSTLDWLNRITDESFRFFGLRGRALADRGFTGRAEVQHRLEAQRLVAVGRSGRTSD